MFSARTVGLTLGVTFILTCVIGFIPNPLVSPDGLFAVNFAHNMVHLVTGLAFIGGTLFYSGREDLVIKVLGAMYALVAIVGFITKGDMLLGFIHINQADRWLHFGLAIAILACGFIFKPVKKRRLAEA